MSVGVLIITHDELGKIFLDTAKAAIGNLPMAVEVLEACRTCDPEDVFGEAKNRLKKLDKNDGVLILTDLFGATPCNVSTRLLEFDNVRVIAGLNLPMLIRVFNYPDDDLDVLAEKAFEAGKSGVMIVTK